MKTEFSNKYHWLVSRTEINNLDGVIKNYHKNHILHLTTFDSGPLIPNEQELKAGWGIDGEIMLSPPLSNDVNIPCEQYDEWYISKNLLTFPKNLDRFVNYSGFNISPEADTEESLVNRFWKQIDTIKPETFVAIGDSNIVVSKNEDLIKFIANKT